MELGFKPSQHDECVFYYGKTVFIVYTDDTILLGPDKDEIDLLVRRLSRSFKIEDQGDLSDYLGIKIERKPDGTLEWTQPTLIQSILKDLKLDGEDIKGRQNKPNIKPVPAHTSVLLTDHRDSPDHNPKDFEYRQVHPQNRPFGPLRKKGSRYQLRHHWGRAVFGQFEAILQHSDRGITYGFVEDL